MEGAHSLESACLCRFPKGKEPTLHGRCGHLPHCTLHVITDDFCHCYSPKRRPGPEASLSDSEVITLAIFARWGRFSSERDFYRYAQSRLRDAFPNLPDRSQFNRLMRSYVGLIEEVALHLAVTLDAQGYASSYEALDTSAMPVRDAKRRGEGWLAGYAYSSDGPTAWDGTRDFACSSLRTTRWERSGRFWLRLCFH